MIKALPIDGDHGDGEQGDADVGVLHQRVYCASASSNWVASTLRKGRMMTGGGEKKKKKKSFMNSP